MPAFGPCRRACGCAGLFFLPPDSAVLSVFAASLFAPSFFPSSVFLLPARVSLCPCLSQPASRQLCRAVLLRLYSVWFFFCHFLFFRSSSIARRLLSVARCAVHRPALAACCPSPIVYPLLPVVHPLPLVVRRPLSIPCCPLSIPCCPLSIPCRLLSIARCAVHRSSPAVCCPSPVVHPLPPVVRRPLRRPSFIARRLLAVARTPYPAAPLSAAVRSGSRLLYPRNPGLRVCGSCLPCRSAAGSVGRSFRKNASALRTLVAAPFLTK